MLFTLKTPAIEVSVIGRSFYLYPYTKEFTSTLKDSFVMETSEKTSITIETTVNAPVEKVWQLWSEPEHITKWNSASEDWHTPHATNDLRTGGKFTSRMEAKDGSMGFDFGGVYDEVIPHKTIAYSMEDGRKVNISFTWNGAETKVTETFDAENSNSAEMQRAGWQAILDNFKKYTEAN